MTLSPNAVFCDCEKRHETACPKCKELYCTECGVIVCILCGTTICISCDEVVLNLHAPFLGKPRTVCAECKGESNV